MASVSSLDQDMRRLRLDRYTPGAADEVRRWIEKTLGERLAPGDLMEALRDGVALCKLVNQAVSPGVRYKASSMPFVQMENISHFLKACEMPPLSLPSHDRFLTVDLYDGKDPAQVLQCIAAFSRRANAVNPSAFPTAVGGKSKGSSMSPQNSGPGQSPYTPKVSSYTSSSPQRQTSPATNFSPNRGSYASGRISPSKTGSLSRGGLAAGGPVSSWSSKDDETKTAPAWNIHQYGYMGGASQGNQGITFGGRRQITSAAPEVSSLAEKENRLREKLEREKRELDMNDQRLRAQQEAEEAQAREEEERRWAEEEQRQRREEELVQQHEGARLQREEQAKRDQEAEDRIAASRNRQRTTSDARLNGQLLSAYQSGQKAQPALPKRDSINNQPPQSQSQSQPQSAEAQRIADLERQLAEMKQQAAERKQQQVQQYIPIPPTTRSGDSTPEKPSLPTRGLASGNMTYQSEPQAQPQPSHEDDWEASEREKLKIAWQKNQEGAPHTPPAPPRPQPAEPAQPQPSSQTARPLPDPSTYQPHTTRTSRFLATNPAPTPSQPTTHIPTESAHSSTAEIDAETARRQASQRSTRAGGWASKSLLEREMERERERQREWEENQKDVASAARDPTQGSGPGQSWDIHQYGYSGGDNQNRGGPGLGIGGRRQLVGPRPPP